jgi:hypothetical protein
MLEPIEPTVYFRALARPEAAALLAISKPPRRLSVWADSLSQNEIARYRQSMDAGSWPSHAGVLRFDVNGVLVGGRELLAAFTSSQLDSVVVCVIGGLGTDAGECF